MTGAYPQTPHKRAFEEFAQDETVETGRNETSEVANDRNALSQAATGLASVLSTAAVMTATTICEVSGRAARAINRTTLYTVQLAQSAKRRLVKLFTRDIQRVSSLRLPERLQFFRKRVRTVPSPTNLPPLASTPRPKRINMNIQSVSRLEKQDHPARNVVFRSLRVTRHQDFPPITRPVPQNQASPLSSELMARRIHGLQDHTIRKAWARSPVSTRRRWVGGWRPTYHKSKGPGSLRPFRSLSTRQASTINQLNRWTALGHSQPRALAVLHNQANFSQNNTTDQSISHTSTADVATDETENPYKPIPRKLFTEIIAKHQSILAHSTASNPFAAAVDLPSDDESDESYAPSDSSSEESDLGDYEDFASDEDLAAVDQGLVSPGPSTSQLYDDDDSPLRAVTSQLDVLDPSSKKDVFADDGSPQDDVDNAEDNVVGSEDDIVGSEDNVLESGDEILESDDNIERAIGDLVEPQVNFETVRVDSEKPQHEQDSHGSKPWNKYDEIAPKLQPGEVQPVLAHDLSEHKPALYNNENDSENYIDPIEAQWQREMLAIRSQDIPTPKRSTYFEPSLVEPILVKPTPPKATPIKPKPIEATPIIPTLRGARPTTPTSHDAHVSAKSERRYNLRTRTSKTHKVKEEDRIKAEKKRKEQARLREEKRLAKQRAKEKETAARRALEAAEKAEWVLRGSRDKILDNLVQPVNTEWMKKVQSAMAGPLSSQVAMSVTGQPLSRHAFGTLLPGPNDNPSAWLNDEIVTAYLDIVCAYGNSQHGITEEAIKKKLSKPKYVAFSTQFMTTLRGPRGYSGVARWAGRKQVGKKDMLGCEYVFVPVHVGGNHWTMLIISPARKTVEYFDSFGHDGSVYTNAIMKYLGEELKEAGFDQDEWRVWSKAGSAVQMNGVDCGVFSVTTAKAVTLGYTPKIAFAQKDMMTQRMRMAAELMNGAFIDPAGGG